MKERGRRGVHAWICASALPWMQLGIASMTLKGDSINGSHCRIMKKRGCCLFFSLPFSSFFSLFFLSATPSQKYAWWKWFPLDRFQTRKVISLTIRMKTNGNSFTLSSSCFTERVNLWNKKFQVLVHLSSFTLRNVMKHRTKKFVKTLIIGR